VLDDMMWVTHCQTRGTSDFYVPTYNIESIKNVSKTPGGYEIFRPSRPALGPTQCPVKWVPGVPWG